MKTFISLIMAGLLLCTNGYAMVEYHVEEFGQLTSDELYENTDFLNNTIYLGEGNGYITSVNGEQFYLNHSIYYCGYQKVYSLDAFNYFRDVFQSVFQYEKTNDGYIVCTPAYRMAMQNYMWNGEGKTVYLYDDNLNLIKQVDFSGDVYAGRVFSVDYYQNHYIVQLVHGGNQKNNDPISYSYYQSNDFVNWTECEKPSKISDYDIVYENGVTSFSRLITGAFFTAYNVNTRKSYISANGIYSVEIPFINANSLNWEDSDNLYFLSHRNLISIPKSALNDQLRTLDNAPKIILNDTLLAFEQPPVVEQDRTLVPMRFLFEQMGAEVGWEGASQTATVMQNGETISFQIGQQAARVNGATRMMDVPAKLKDDKTMVPLRFLSENLGYAVEWDGETNTVRITTTSSQP